MFLSSVFCPIVTMNVIVVVVVLLWLLLLCNHHHHHNASDIVPVGEAVANLRESLRFVLDVNQTMFYSERLENLYEWTDLSRFEQSVYGKLPYGIFDMFGWSSKDKLNAFGVNDKTNRRVPYDRRASDERPWKCRHWHYDPRVMPKVSVIIPFHEEDMIVLTRTIFSVLLNSPRSILKEVIVMADGCCNQYTNGTLSYLNSEIYSNRHQQHLLNNIEIFRMFSVELFLEYLPLLFGENVQHGKVRVFKTQERFGWSRSIHNVLSQVTGDVLVVLTSHVEVSANWLIPLLAPIVQNERTVAVPVLGQIDRHNFYFSVESPSAVYWDGALKTRKVRLDQVADYHFVNRWKKNETIRTFPRKVDLLSQVQFAIARSYAEQIGLFDSDHVVNPNAGHVIWDYTYKIRKCGGGGGRILVIPCSLIYELPKLMVHSMGQVVDRTHRAFNYQYEPDCLRRQFAIEFLDPNVLLHAFYVHYPILDCPPSSTAAAEAATCSHRPEKAREHVTVDNDSIELQTFRSGWPPPRNVEFGQLVNVAYAVCMAPEKLKNQVVMIGSYCSAASSSSSSNPRGRLLRLNQENQLFYGVECLIPNLVSNQIQLSDDCRQDLSKSWHYDNNNQQLIVSTYCLDYWPEKGFLFTKCSDNSSQRWHWLH